MDLAERGWVSYGGYTKKLDTHIPTQPSNLKSLCDLSTYILSESAGMDRGSDRCRQIFRSCPSNQPYSLKNPKWHPPF